MLMEDLLLCIAGEAISNSLSVSRLLALPFSLLMLKHAYVIEAWCTPSLPALQGSISGGISLLQMLQWSEEISCKAHAS